MALSCPMTPDVCSSDLATGTAGYVFQSWTLPTGTSAANPIIVTVNSDQTVTAVYIANPSIPTLNEWGMIIFALLAVTAGYYLRRRQRGEA
ncbi:MAG: IPTL-CTERM sorting domain-containing protein [Deltaproteobacteria bacterium]|nr:IPTL-CTERM sorting domain-containing protein [Deltaproteobacteria bacterium]